MRSKPAEIESSGLSRHDVREYRLQTDGSGRILSAGEDVISMMGYGRKDVFIHSVFTLFSTFSIDIPTAGLDDLFIGKTVIECDALLPAGNQSPVPVHWTISRQFTAGETSIQFLWQGKETAAWWPGKPASPYFIFDVRKAAQPRQVADDIPVLIIESSEQGEIVYVNRYFTSFTGLQAHEANLESIRKLVHPDDESSYGLLVDAEEQQLPGGNLKYRLRHHSGQYRWVMQTTVASRNGSSARRNTICLVDVHEDEMAEKKLEFQSGLVDKASDVIIATDDAFMVLTWNRKAEEIYEISAKDAIGRSVTSLIAHEFTGDSPAIAMEKLKRDGIWQGEVRHRKKNGSKMTLLSVVSALRDSRSTVIGYISVNRDITDRLTAEEAVRQNELRFKAILGNLADVVFVLDYKGAVNFVTPSVQSVLGHEEATVKGRQALAFVHPADARRCRALFKELTGNPATQFVRDVRVRHRNGEWAWIEAKGINCYNDQLVKGIIFSLHDISERKKAEQQLQSYSGHITNILNSITDGFVALDQKLTIVWWNTVAEKLTGTTAEAVLGKHLWQVLPELKETKKFHRHQKALENGKGFSFELFIGRLNGYFDINAYPSQQGFFLYFKDITYRKRQQMLLALEKNVLEMNTNPDASLKHTVDFFLKGMEKLNPGIICSVLLLNEDLGTLWHLSSPSLSKSFVKKIDGVKIGPFAGSCGTSMYRGQMVIVPDISTDPLWVKFRAIAAKYKLAACWSFPIETSSNKLLGAFAGYYKEVLSPDGEQIELFRRVASLMGVIIENKLAEQKINISNERYMLATRATNDAIWDYDIRSRRLYRGESFYTIFGYAPADCQGKPGFWESRLHPGDRAKTKRIYAEAIDNSERGVIYSEYRFLKADGSYVLVADRSFIIWDKDGHANRFVGAMQDITDRKNIEERVLAQEIGRQKSIAQAVVNAQENERAEIGKELHDNVNQILSTAKLYLELAKTDTAQKEVLIKKSADSIFTAINEIRHISKALVPPSVKDLGLIESINDLVESLHMTTPLKVNFIHLGEFEKSLDDKHKLMLFRIIQEQVSNVLKHAEAGRLTIDLAVGNKHINLSIVDNGKGFLLEKVKFKKGVGLTNIESRVHLFNGKVSINTAPGKGCKLVVEVPLHHF
jgi:PAS domain S-box-containing protein